MGRLCLNELGEDELCLSVYLVVVKYGRMLYNMNGYITDMDYTIVVSIHYMILY